MCKPAYVLVVALTLAGRAGICQSALETPHTIPHAPAWLKASAELRGRADYMGESGTAYLQRLRVSLEAEPVSWLRLFAQGNDSRTGAGSLAPLRNPLDLRQGYLEVRHRGFSVRAGRQELSLGDESLIGGDGEWCNLGRSFDAVTLQFGRGPATVRAFSGQAVQPSRQSFDRSSASRQLTGLHVEFSAHEQASIQPFLLSKRTRGEFARSIYTAGVFAEGTYGGWEYSGQAAWQGGESAGVAATARAAAVRAGRPIVRSDRSPTAYASFRWASGQSGEGRAAFDDLYPAGYNSAGMLDPFAWRNLRELGYGTSWPVHRRFSVVIEHRWYWLSSLADGVYVDDGAPIAIDRAAPSARLGDQFAAGATVQATRSVRLCAGYGLLRPGPWLRATGHNNTTPAAYLAIAKSF